MYIYKLGRTQKYNKGKYNRSENTMTEDIHSNGIHFEENYFWIFGLFFLISDVFYVIPLFCFSFAFITL